jgi:hypothetical protein
MEFEISVSYPDILLNIASDGRLTTALHNKSDDSKFALVKFS